MTLVTVTAYDKGLAVKALVLTEISEEPSSTSEVLTHVNRRCFTLGRKVDGFDFQWWVGTTLWGVLDSFLECGYVEVNDESIDWCLRTVRITDDGKHFLRLIREEAPHVMQLLEDPA